MGHPPPVRLLRNILFWLFLALYLVAAPVLILYALGYLYKPGSERGLFSYGLISLGSTPDDAQVFLGNSRYARRTPALIRDLLPGAYDLRLQRAGHEPWHGVARVKAERATLLDRIILLPAPLAPRRVLDGTWTDLRGEPGDRDVLLAGGSRLGAWARLDAARQLIVPLLATNSPWADVAVERHRLVPGDPHLLVMGRHRGEPLVLWLRVDDPEAGPEDITRLFPEDPDEIVWDPQSRHELIARVGDRLHRVETRERALYPDWSAAGRGMALRRGRLLLLADTNALLRVGRDGEQTPTDYALPDTARALLRDARHAIFALPDERALFLDSQGALIANVPPWRLVPEGVRAILPADSPQWLALAGRKLFRIAANRDDEAALLCEEILDHPRPIQRAAWIHEDTHILFSSAGRIHLLALERGGGPAARPLVECHADGAFHFSEAGGVLYFLDREGRLSALRLLPPDRLIPLPRGAGGAE